MLFRSVQHEQNCVFRREKKERNKRERGRKIEIHRLIDNQTDRQTDRRTDRQTNIYVGDRKSVV